MPNNKGRKDRSFGSIDQLPSRRWRARYKGADGQTYSAKTHDGKPLTFETKGDAEAYLALRQSEILRNSWLPPETSRAAGTTFRDYAATWLAERQLEVRTRELYASLLRNHINPAFGDLTLAEISPAKVQTWHARDAKPTAKAHSYALLRTILGTAVRNDQLNANPCRVSGGGQARTVKRIRPATDIELGDIAARVPEKYKAMVLLGAWCSMRFGEMAGLQRQDLDLTEEVVFVRRAIVKTSEGRLVKAPKTEAGIRAVTIPRHIVGDLRSHMSRHAQPGPTGWVFPSPDGGPMPHGSFEKVFKNAAKAVGRPDLTIHGLRHTGQTMLAEAGATVSELQARAGQSTPAMALRYTHATDARARLLADRLAERGIAMPTPNEGTRSNRGE